MVVFHRYVLPLLWPTAKVVPFGANATAATELELLRVAVIFPVVVFHRYVLPLSSPTAKVVPFRANAWRPRSSWSC